MRVRTCLRISDAATSCLRGPHCAYLPAWLIFVFACRSVEEGISKPLQTLTRVLPTQALQDIMEARAPALLAARASLDVSNSRAGSGHKAAAAGRRLGP